MVNFLKHQEVLKLKDILADNNRFLRTELQRLSGEDIIGGDFGLRGVMEMVHQVAPLNFDRFLTTQPEVETQPGLIPDDGPFKPDEVMSKHIQQVLAIAKGKIHGSGGAAELLGINPGTLLNRMNQLGITYGRKRKWE
jgi:hypothetical protein